MMDKFKLVSDYTPSGDQPEAIAKLVDGIKNGMKEQTLLGVTGSGKTFTMANVIAQLNRPTLVFAHNKTLAAQLCSEFREFFPENAVEYFVSYYDYYQPEAYVPSTDSYIEKDSAVNDEIDKLRHSATLALAERRDVIIVASVSCIYSLGSPIDYRTMVVSIRQGMELSREELLAKLVSIQYERNDVNFIRNKFRVRGDVVEIFPAGSTENAIRVEFFGDEVERISEINSLTGNVIATLSHAAVYPASHYVISRDKMEGAIAEIERELEERVAYFKENHMLIEAQRIEQRTRYDIEMLQEIGFCKGIENYSRILAGRAPGSIPYTLLDHFPEDFLIFVDESHVSLPQIRGMSAGDRGRKTTLIDYGFRLPSAYDNRPLNFEEFYGKVNQAVFVSATPGELEREKSAQIVEQVIRPTGLVDPEIIVKPVQGQIEDLVLEINERAAKNERVLVTTLTKKMAEDLTAYFEKLEIRVRYMHYDVDTIERMELIRDLRLGEYDVLVGINLLREGLDIPEVSLVAILDADKEGFLRSESSLIQTIGRAARNAEGKVIMYADSVTRSMENAIRETERRRKIQMDYNEKHGIKPKTIIKEVRDVIEISSKVETESKTSAKKQKHMTAAERQALIEKLTAEMKNAAKLLEFEHAAYLRDKINDLKGLNEKKSVFKKQKGQ
ncbi:MAG: excinuclease ABC subunit UvrB [Oscillospiraceae bacterium]|nr:excinuclease ABC subunit UvrB [Oscillospiraceae bacterium]